MGRSWAFVTVAAPMGHGKKSLNGVRDLNHCRLPLIDRESYPFFPVFLYDEDAMDGTATKGLFRGPLLVKVSFASPLGASVDEHLKAYRYIFLGPSQSHAVSSRGSKKKGNAEIHGMHAVKASTICYTVIQVSYHTAAHDHFPTI